MNVHIVCSILDGIRKGSCLGKRRYTHLDLAERVLERMRSQLADASGNEAYYCVFCNYFHIGRSSLQIKKKMQKYLTLENLLVYDFTRSEPRRTENQSVLACIGKRPE